MSQADVIGYAAALLVFVTFWMKTMVPLRTLGIASNLFFIGYGYLAGAYPPLVLHILLLPLNVMRLHEMLRLNQQLQDAATGNLNLDWLKPFTSSRRMTTGEVLFRKGDAADRMFLSRPAAAGLSRTASTLFRERWSANWDCLRPTRRVRKRWSAWKRAIIRNNLRAA
jgi:hypothetical protein